MKKALIILLFLVVLVIGCQNINDIEKFNEAKSVSGSIALNSLGVYDDSNNSSSAKESVVVSEKNVSEEKNEVEENVENEENIENKSKDSLTYFTKEYTEGELIKLDPKAIDAEGDELTFEFSQPLDKNGEWQTKKGDAGEYKVLVTASDGKSKTSAEVTLIVNELNTPPQIVNFEDVTVKEGNKVVFSPKITDSDGDELNVKYSGWMDSNEKLTSYDDAGKYNVKLTVSDSENEVSKEITVTVENVNRAPLFELSGSRNEIEVKVGETVFLDVDAKDPDGDNLQIIYGKPFYGKENKWTPTENDLGTHEVVVAVSDGYTSVNKTYVIKVLQLNNAPQFVDGSQKLEVLIQVGDTVVLTPEFTDKDGDKLTITYEGWMTAQTKRTTSEDSGIHGVTIKASDGQDESVVIVKVTVNTPPVFVGV